MNASAYQPIYQQAQALLQRLQQANLSDAELLASLAQAQQQLQQGLSPDSASDLGRQLQPLQIEINKQMRLLETDAIFLKAARQPATAHQRRQQIQVRVGLLLRYSEAILALCAADLGEPPA